ncbi:MAG: YfhO family protein [Clostridium sp.]|uniref:YfhO family protein n=1 Tax=Clostridium sp. TaxID=1506 RepID=UPI0025BE57BB|nr:YfhO family protein [Clostridium sp.]MCF0147280.1 YfhO family protein [Clostridium sp.]
MDKYKNISLKLRNIQEYILTSIIIIVFMLCIYYLKGLYPFGNNSIIYADMVQQIAPFYYNFYDIINGSASIFYDFNTAMGFNIFSTISSYFLSPFSYIILLFKRENIILAINIVFMAKIIGCGLSCTWLLKKYFNNLKTYWVVFLSLLYALSSYNMIMYQIINWLDIVIIFPILLVALRSLLDNKKVTLYIITLAFIMLMSYQLGFMVILFILFTSGIYIKLYVEKMDRKNRIFLLGVGTIASSLIAFIKILPAIIQTFESSRAGGNINGILTSHTSYMYDRISFLFSGAIIYPLIFLLILKYKQNKEFLILTLSALMLTLLPVVVDPVNRLWHMGSYSSFPFRYGFIPILIFIIMAAYYINKYESKTFKNYNFQKGKCLIEIALLAIVIVILIFIEKKYYVEIQQAVSSLTLYVNLKVFKLLLLASGSILLVSLIIFIIERGNYNNIFVKLVLIILMSSYSLFNLYNYIGIESMMNRISDKYNHMNNIYDYEFNEENNYYRIKDRDQIYTTYTANTPFVINKKSLAHYTSVNNNNHMLVMKKLGYGSNWTRTYDGGGTLFTDSVFNIKYVISNRELDSSIYKYVNETDDIKIYENKFYIPNGIKMLKDSILNDVLEANSVFEAQNNIYKSISNGNENIIEELTDFNLINLSKEEKERYQAFRKIDENQKAYIEFEIDSLDKNQLYLNVLKDLENSKNSAVYNSLKIYINGEPYNSYFDGIESNEFPTEINNGLLDLGQYGDEKVKVDIEVIKNFETKELSIGLLDIDKLELLANKYANVTSDISVNKNKIKSTVDGKLGENLFIAIPFDKGFNSKINGNSVTIEKAFDNFISIPLIEGENRIELIYIPKGLILGSIISFTTILICIVVIILNKNGIKLRTDIYEGIAYYIYIIIYSLTILVIYIIPIIFFIYYWISR